jgi:hypothetical protein
LSLSPTELEERSRRLRAVAEEMDRLMKEVGPKWLRIAHLKQEAESIMQDIGADANE